MGLTNKYVGRILGGGAPRLGDNRWRRSPGEKGLPSGAGTKNYLLEMTVSAGGAQTVSPASIALVSALGGAALTLQAAAGGAAQAAGIGTPAGVLMVTAQSVSAIPTAGSPTGLMQGGASSVPVSSALGVTTTTMQASASSSTATIALGSPTATGSAAPASTIATFTIGNPLLLPTLPQLLDLIGLAQSLLVSTSGSVVMQADAQAATTTPTLGAATAHALIDAAPATSLTSSGLPSIQAITNPAFATSEILIGAASQQMQAIAGDSTITTSLGSPTASQATQSVEPDGLESIIAIGAPTVADVVIIPPEQFGGGFAISTTPWELAPVADSGNSEAGLLALLLTL